MSESNRGPESQAIRTGLGYALAAYLWWGLVPIYFKQVAAVPSIEVLAHRVVWSLILLTAWLRFRGRMRLVVSALRDRKTMRLLLCSTALIGCNWFVFIWAVANEQIREASLGYFVVPEESHKFFCDRG